jgi:hypothetical protein
MPDLVDSNQTAFIRGRCIQDNFLLVKSSAKLLHSKRIPSFMLKVDVAKAFDSISWPFLLDVLRHRGFGPRWLRWIALLLRTASTCVLVNGCGGAAFLHGRGLRQGDPISPLLFVIAMDVLSTMLRTAEQAGVLSDLASIGLRSRVSLYADDVVIFAKATAVDLQVVWAVLDCFGVVSSLKANPAKSSAAPIQCSDDVLEAVAPSLPCPLSPLPCSYLGLPLSIRKPRKAELQALLDKLAAKLPFWKARLMSREGRLVYVQAVMTASVVYHLLALDVDPWFIKAVDKLRRGFFWAGKDDARGGCCMVAWHSVCQPKSLGGLGLHNLRRLNVALRTRWLWLQRSDGSKPWLGLDVRVSAEARALFDASVSIEVGSGASDLVREPVRRRRSVQAGLEGNAWAADITGELSVPEIVQYLRLWEAIAHVPRVGEGEDRFSWKWRGDGQFSSKSAYRVLWHGTCGLPGATLVWDSFAPLQFKLHAWLALRRRCWTADRRLCRGLPTHTLCPLCNVADETLDHISLHCGFA